MTENRIKNVVYIVSALSVLLYVWIIYQNGIVRFKYFDMYQYLIDFTKFRKVRNDLFTAYELLVKLVWCTIPISVIIPYVSVLNIGIIILSSLYNFFMPIRWFIKHLRNFSYRPDFEAIAFNEYSIKYSDVDHLFHILLMFSVVLALFYISLHTSIVGVAIRTLFPSFVQSLTKPPTKIDEKKSPANKTESEVKRPKGKETESEVKRPKGKETESNKRPENSKAADKKKKNK